MKTKTIRRMALLLAALALLPFTSSAQTVRGDFDMDGDINISDVVTALNYLLSGSLSGDTPTDETLTVNGVSFVMVHVKGGVYTRSRDSRYTVDDFSIGQTEVTRELWGAVMGSVPTFGFNNGPQSAVDRVSWEDCQLFIDSLNALTGRHFRLPTESEWEYAAGGGLLTHGYLYAGSDNIDDVAWYSGNNPEIYPYPPIPQVVAGKEPNELGLYDMSGNVREWCQCYRLYPLEGYAVLRGGNILDNAATCSVTWHSTSVEITLRNESVGLRLAE